MAKSELLKDAGVSEREAEVLGLVGDHLSNAQIAHRLSISVRTVESHVSSLLRKLDLTDRRGLADLATSLDETTHDREGTGLGRWRRGRRGGCRRCRRGQPDPLHQERRPQHRLPDHRRGRP